MIRADNLRENIPKDIQEFSLNNGIKIELSPAYKPESNDMDERLVQEHWLDKGQSHDDCNQLTSWTMRWIILSRRLAQKSVA